MDKIAIISHILPPSPSGQAVVLDRLFADWPPERYCLISIRNYEETGPVDDACAKMKGRYYRLDKPCLLPEFNRSWLFAFNIILNALWGIYRRAVQIKRIALREQCSLLIGCTGDLYDLPAAYLASKWAGLPLVAYLFDDYRYQWTGFYRTMAAWMEPAVLKHAKGIIVPNEFMQHEYHHRYGIDSMVIHNPCLLPDLRELDRTPKVLNSGEINIVYTGSVYHVHFRAFHNLIKAIERLGRSDVKLHIYTAQPRSIFERNGLNGSMVTYHPHVRHSDVPMITRQADILFLPLAFDSAIPEVVRTSAPGKTGDYLAVGRPILVHAPSDSFISWYFKKHQCGMVIDANDPDALSTGIRELIEDSDLKKKLGLRARAMAEKDFSANVIKRNFSDFIQGIEDSGHDSSV